MQIGSSQARAATRPPTHFCPARVKSSLTKRAAPQGSIPAPNKPGTTSTTFLRPEAEEKSEAPATKSTLPIFGQSFHKSSCCNSKSTQTKRQQLRKSDKVVLCPGGLLPRCNSPSPLIIAPIT